MELSNLQNAENVRQLRSRFIEIPNVPLRVRLGFDSPVALLGPSRVSDFGELSRAAHQVGTREG